MRKNNGITLIALIITVILLLILVGVSVNLLIKGDLFGSAEKAVSGTNAKVEEQQSRVDDLMGELSQAEIFAEGIEPKLKYKVFGNEILVYLEHSLYDYVSQKSLNEKEQIYAEIEFKASNIEDVIRDQFNNDREEYENFVIEDEDFDYGNYGYEDALNSAVMWRYNQEWYFLEFSKKILNINNISRTDLEKEDRIASIENVTKEEVRNVVQRMANKQNWSYSKMLDLMLTQSEMHQMSENDIDNAMNVKLTLPNGNVEMFYYDDEYYYQTYEVGQYKFIAENYKGKKSDVTVPVEGAKFKVRISDTDIRTYEFFPGQTWEDFIGGETEIRVMNDGSKFYYYVYLVGYYNSSFETEKVLWFKNDAYDDVRIYNEIIADTTYDLVEGPGM